MKRKEILFIPILIISVGFVNAQDLSEKLGGVKTNFRFTSDTIDLNVSDQFIIKNAGAYNRTEEIYSGGYGYAAGYDSYHLEFITNKNLSYEYFKRYTSFHFIISFYNSDNILLTKKQFYQEVSRYRNPDIKGSPIFYSIDLYNIPVSLLDKTSRINIIRAIPKNHQYNK